MSHFLENITLKKCSLHLIVTTNMFVLGYSQCSKLSKWNPTMDIHVSWGNVFCKTSSSTTIILNRYLWKSNGYRDLQSFNKFWKQMNLKLMVTKAYSPILLKLKIKFNLNHFYISFLVNPSSKLSKENLQKAGNIVLMESAKRWHWSVTVKEIGKAPIKFFILEVSLSLTWCRRNAGNDQTNDGFSENCFRL